MMLLGRRCEAHIATLQAEAVSAEEKARGKSLSFVLSWQKETNIEETWLRLGRVGEVAVT